MTYAVALEREGDDFVNEFVWCEPSGRPFNSHELFTDQVSEKRRRGRRV